MYQWIRNSLQEIKHELVKRAFFPRVPLLLRTSSCGIAFQGDSWLSSEPWADVPISRQSPSSRPLSLDSDNRGLGMPVCTLTSLLENLLKDSILRPISCPPGRTRMSQAKTSCPTIRFLSCFLPLLGCLFLLGIFCTRKTDRPELTMAAALLPPEQASYTSILQ